jgi:hypothetical protein
LLIAAPPTLAPSILNSTIPEAVEGRTVAVSVTISEGFTGFRFEATWVVELAFSTFCPPARVPVLGPNVASPLYSAATEEVPTGGVEVMAIETVPPEMGAGLPTLTPSILNCTVPVAVDGVTVAVNVIDSPNCAGLMLDVTVVLDCVAAKAGPAVAINMRAPTTLMATRRPTCLPLFTAGLPAIFRNSIPCVMAPLLDSKLSRPVLLERWTGSRRRNDPPIRKVRTRGTRPGYFRKLP